MNELTSFSIGDEDELSGFTITGWYINKVYAKKFAKVTATITMEEAV